MDENAMYINGASEDAKDGQCYTATFAAVPVKVFYSSTLYGPDNYLMSNGENINSSNRGLVSNDNGSFTVAFRAEECRDLAPNFTNTPNDGWSLLLRAYRPGIGASKANEMPEILLVE